MLITLYLFWVCYRFLMKKLVLLQEILRLSVFCTCNYLFELFQHFSLFWIFLGWAVNFVYRGCSWLHKTSIIWFKYSLWFLSWVFSCSISFLLEVSMLHTFCCCFVDGYGYPVNAKAKHCPTCKGTGKVSVFLVLFYVGRIAYIPL